VVLVEETKGGGKEGKKVNFNEVRHICNCLPLLILCFSIVLVVLPGALIQENEIKPIHV
jgi:hypothetical protein